MNTPDPVVTTPAEHCVFGSLLARWASERPDASFARFPNQPAWSYRQAYELACQTADRLRTLGVRQDDRVLCWLPNGPEMLRVWLAVNLLGATFVPFNISYRGNTLQNVLKLSQARLLVGHGQLVPRLAEVPLEALTDVIVVGHSVEPIAGLRLHGVDVLEGGSAAPIQTERPIQAHDTQSIIFTSGTTGPSKAVLSSYAHLYAQGAEAFDFFTEDDCFMVNLPMFHCGGTIPVGVALARGGAITVLDKFRVDDFWDLVRQTHTTVAYVIVGLPNLLLKRPASGQDKEHPLRVAIMSAALGPEFRQRFGCDYYTIFNMSEVCTPIRSDRNPVLAKSCGRLRRGIDARLVDASDSEVANGEVGELMLRTARPWMLSHGYAADPQATASAWRNGWFHTGDLFRKDNEGNFYFIDRLKDSIRRKGENISSVEVEAAAASHPSVLESAAIPVRDEHGDEEVLMVVVYQPGAMLQPQALIEHLVQRLPYFMVPRYVRVAQELPKTPTGKVQKAALRAQGLGGDSWDREQAGIILKKEQLI